MKFKKLLPFFALCFMALLMGCDAINPWHHEYTLVDLNENQKFKYDSGSQFIYSNETGLLDTLVVLKNEFSYYIYQDADLEKFQIQNVKIVNKKNVQIIQDCIRNCVGNDCLDDCISKNEVNNYFDMYNSLIVYTEKLSGRIEVNGISKIQYNDTTFVDSYAFSDTSYIKTMRFFIHEKNNSLDTVIFSITNGIVYYSLVNGENFRLIKTIP